MKMNRVGTIFIWIGAAVICAGPIIAATFSPLLAWREPIYILGSFAGIFALALLFLQPLMSVGLLPGLDIRRSKNLHHWIGGTLVLMVVIHVLALWVTSPPDVIDALLFQSPTQFSIWGITAMWALFASAFLALFKKILKLRYQTWKKAHKILAAVIVIGTVLHAMLIEGTMETVTKASLCAFVLIATYLAFLIRRQKNPN